MELKPPPANVYLYWYTSEFQPDGNYSVSEHKFSEGNKQWKLLSALPVDWGPITFDPVAAKLDHLNQELGKAVGKVNHIKEEIQKLLAIGHDEAVEVEGEVAPSFATCDWPNECECPACSEL